MVVSKQHRKQVMIFNQNALDLFSSILLVVTYGAKLAPIPLNDLVGYWLCMWLLSENILWCGILASKVNLMVVTIERYLKVVHRLLSKKVLQPWVLLSASAFSWVSGFALSIGITLSTTRVVNGVCISYVFWSSPVSIRHRSLLHHRSWVRQWFCYATGHSHATWLHLTSWLRQWFSLH